MVMTLATAILTALAAASGTDTTFKVRDGTRLTVHNVGGRIDVGTWGRSSVRIRAAHSPRVRVAIGTSGSIVDVRAAARRGVPKRVDYRITVPAWMPLNLSGVYSDVSIEGSKGAVSAETVQGDVRLRGGAGFIKLSSVQGAVAVRGARGRLEASSINQRIQVTDVVGDVSVEAVNGDVTLDGIDSRWVEAVTVNGNVTYAGAIRDRGRYRFASHNGNLVIAVPERANATISVATFSGDFESVFPVHLMETRKGRRFDFLMGNGSAQLDLETFDGRIHLRRPAKAGSEGK